MNDLNESGPPCGLNGDFEETPEPTLARKLAASIYLAERGIKGTLEDICYYLTIENAQVRAANKEMYEVLSNETNRYRTRFKLERELASDALDEVEDLQAKVEMLTTENGYITSACITAQERLDNALAMYDEISPMITWDELLNG